MRKGLIKDHNSVPYCLLVICISILCKGIPKGKVDSYESLKKTIWSQLQLNTNF